MTWPIDSEISHVMCKDDPPEVVEDHQLKSPFEGWWRTSSSPEDSPFHREVRDIVDDLNPPDRAIALCLDERRLV
jgi:hypothetical protein